MALQRADPYTVEPIRSCQRGIARNGDFKRAEFVQTGTIPPYALWLFAPFAVLPFAWAAALYGLFIAGCTVATVGAARKLSTLPLWALALAIGSSDGLTSLINGQLVPIALLAAALSALWLRERRYDRAAIAAACTMLEPHLGVLVCVSAFIWVPQMRRILGGAAVLLAVLSVATAGLRLSAEYVTQAIPAQVHAEVAYAGQYSVASLAYDLGLPESVDAILGGIFSLAMGAAGIWMAGLIARRHGLAAAIVVIPPAFSLLGAYTHLPPFAFVVLAAVVLMSVTRSAPLWGAIVLCAVPWGMLVNYAGGPLTAALISGGLVAAAAPSATALRAFAASLTAFAFLWVLRSIPNATAPAGAASILPAGALAADQWSAIVHAQHPFRPWWLLVKLPTWGGAVAFAYASARAALREKYGALAGN
ncbi:MAG: DUF2029 domain-containing protein [Candidatus Eremiobacteraeota bacterium]|nr:DUF2029 domain-containing protein [Candidatus Eremiobacteraeota bacterium]